MDVAMNLYKTYNNNNNNNQTNKQQKQHKQPYNILLFYFFTSPCHYNAIAPPHCASGTAAVDCTRLLLQLVVDVAREGGLVVAVLISTNRTAISRVLHAPWPAQVSPMLLQPSPTALAARGCALELFLVICNSIISKDTPLFGSSVSGLSCFRLTVVKSIPVDKNKGGRVGSSEECGGRVGRGVR